MAHTDKNTQCVKIGGAIEEEHQEKSEQDAE
jgi:hypothetical protein